MSLPLSSLSMSSSTTPREGERVAQPDADRYESAGWHVSSLDLRSGLEVTEVFDTLPAELRDVFI
jgi:hypothetical protein